MADVTPLLSNGTPAARVDITFVAEGYLASERDKFLADAARFLDYMFNSGNAALNTPFSQYLDYFNANALFVASNQSRWNVTSGMADTYFKANTYLADGRLVYGDSAKVYETVSASLPQNAQDITIVLINSKAYGGAGGSLSWVTTGNMSSAEILLHELGHSIAGMADEYIDPALGSSPLNGPVRLPNVTTEKDSPPWAAWLGYEDSLGKVGVYEGGYYRSSGVWRATQDSKMLHLGQPFNAPQKEALALSFYRMAGDYLALDARIPGLYIADVPDPTRMAYTWSRDGAVLSTDYRFDAYGASLYGSGAQLTLSTRDATGLIRTGLDGTRQSESVTLQGQVVDMAGDHASIADGGRLFRFDGGSNTVSFQAGAAASYVDGGNGVDTLVLGLAQGQVTLEQLATGTWLLGGAAAPLLALRNVEFIQFSDTLRALSELVFGTGGNDYLHNRAGSEVVDGGAGTDLLRYGGARAGFVVEKSGGGFTVTDRAGGAADVLTSVERLLFDDAVIALDIDGVGGQVYRLYQAAFDRIPDSGGLGYWIKAMDGGYSLHEVAKLFMDQNEFRALYGSATSNAQIIDKLYQHILHRPGDSGGTAFWLDILDQGKADLASVLAAISESPENQDAVASLIGDGFAYAPWG